MSYYLGPLLPVKLSKLNTADLDAFYAALRNGGGRGGRPLAVSTVRRVHSVVRAALEQGVRWGWLRENPAARASPGPGQVPEIHPPAPEAVLALLQRAEQTTWMPFRSKGTGHGKQGMSWSRPMDETGRQGGRSPA